MTASDNGSLGGNAQSSWRDINLRMFLVWAMMGIGLSIGFVMALFAFAGELQSVGLSSLESWSVLAGMCAIGTVVLIRALIKDDDSSE